MCFLHYVATDIYKVTKYISFRSSVNAEPGEVQVRYRDWGGWVVCRTRASLASASLMERGSIGNV